MKAVTSYLFILVASALLSSCIHSYYIPSSHNVPLLTEKFDGRVSANFYWTSRDYFNTIPGFELQGSYAITNHLGVMGSLLTAGKGLDSISFDAKYGDLGIGYFTTVNKKLVFEVYGGYGLGSTQNRFGSNAFSAGEYSKAFIQPVVGLKTPYFDMAFSWRFAYISHNSLRVYGTLPNMPPNNAQEEFDLTLNRPTYTVGEPAITLRAGTEMLKIQIQTGWSIMYNSSETPRVFGSASLVLMLPIVVRE